LRISANWRGRGNKTKAKGKPLVYWQHSRERENTARAGFPENTYILFTSLRKKDRRDIKAK